MKTKPKPGNLVTVHGIACRIIAIHPMGTIDCQEIGGTGRCWRISGLGF